MATTRIPPVMFNGGQTKVIFIVSSGRGRELRRLCHRVKRLRRRHVPCVGANRSDTMPPVTVVPSPASDAREAVRLEPAAGRGFPEHNLLETVLPLFVISPPHGTRVASSSRSIGLLGCRGIAWHGRHRT